jgi:hypothetical protein
MVLEMQFLLPSLDERRRILIPFPRDAENRDWFVMSVVAASGVVVASCVVVASGVGGRGRRKVENQLRGLTIELIED